MSLARSVNGNGAATLMDRVFRCEAHIATGDDIDVRHFHVEERMSALYEARLVVVSDNPDIDFEAVVGREMRFVARGAQTRSWKGLCAHLRQLRVEANHLSTYELTLVPKIWLSTQRRNFRMFQRKSEIDIVLEILGEWGITPTSRLSGKYAKRKYRVQYGETDFTFICRMLEDAGVSFYFDNDGESTLVLDDGPDGNEARLVELPHREPHEERRHLGAGRRVGAPDHHDLGHGRTTAPRVRSRTGRVALARQARDAKH